MRQLYRIPLQAEYHMRKTRLISEINSSAACYTMNALVAYGSSDDEDEEKEHDDDDEVRPEKRAKVGRPLLCLNTAEKDGCNAY